MSDVHEVQLLAYADRIGGDFAALKELLGPGGSLDAFNAVHVLPFFVPFDGADAGFDPIDHTEVDPRLGSWGDVAALAAAGLGVTADLIVNHVAERSPQFQDWLAHGSQSAHNGMFLCYDTVFPDGASEADITAVYRPRPGLPFTPFRLADGTKRLVWTTFLPSQIDLDVEAAPALAYLTGILDTFAAAGVSTVRLDAIGYAIKRAGTSCFMIDECVDFVDRIVQIAHARGLSVLVEMHGHYSNQLRLAAHVDDVYDFAFSGLVLHAFASGGDLAPMRRWLDVRPTNAVTVLDTHDGIGVIDAGPQDDLPGLITEEQMAQIFDYAAAQTGGTTTTTNSWPAFVAVPHQINSTYFDVLGGDDNRYLLARALQLFLPGIPQIYYVGLLAGHNDMSLFDGPDTGRNVNRHVYNADELARELTRPVVGRLLDLVRLRREHPAFEGEFSWRIDGSVVDLEWINGTRTATVRADFAAETFEVRADGTVVLA